jgi:hypothetical protein
VSIFPSSEKDKRRGEKASGVDAPSRTRSGTKMSTSSAAGLASAVGGLASGSPKTVLGISAT